MRDALGQRSRSVRFSTMMSDNSARSRRALAPGIRREWLRSPRRYSIRTCAGSSRHGAQNPKRILRLTQLSRTRRDRVAGLPSAEKGMCERNISDSTQDSYRLASAPSARSVQISRLAVAEQPISIDQHFGAIVSAPRLCFYCVHGLKLLSRSSTGEKKCPKKSTAPAALYLALQR
jgi:hypothetical protein